MAMTACPCDDPPKRPLVIPVGLSALPRQTQTFPEVRQALLELVGATPALASWRARGERDFGLMWLEMWAYVCDVLGFYDERIANESYIRTAVRRPSLRRLVDMLGYLPAPGIAGKVTLAAIAEGRTRVSVRAGTGFRSDAFDGESPQVFESDAKTSIHLLTNSWEIGPITATRSSSDEGTTELIFETANFGLAKNRFVFVTDNDEFFFATKVTDVRPFEGKDGRTYVRVSLFGEIQLPTDVDLTNIEVKTPSVTAVAARIGSAQIRDGGADNTVVALDTVYRQAREGERLLVVRGSSGPFTSPLITLVEEVLVPIGTDANPGDNVPVPQVPLTEVTLDEAFFDDDVPQNSYTFHFGLIDAGRLAEVAETDPDGDVLTRSGGVDVVGLVERPPNASSSGKLEQPFLLRDADNRGALVTGQLRVRSDRTATFRVLEGDLPSRLKTPITVFGNLIDATRGESVRNEILGSGDARVPHQTFKLKKKPLTYLLAGSSPQSTLSVFVDDVRWSEVRSFFGRGPNDRVYIVRTDDQGNSHITFGDGVRGARLPSGVRNVVASYRFGSGLAAPPAGAIRQLARSVKGLRRVESPIAAEEGKDPDPPETLRTAAPKSVLLFGRPVSALDFEVLAGLLSGVVQATAEFGWIESQQQAGILVTYIGTAREEDVLEALRNEAEPGLPIAVRKATAVEATFSLRIEVHRDFGRSAVKNDVRAVLIDPDTGPLALKNVPIGRPLIRSALFDLIHSRPGVVSALRAKISVSGPDFNFRFVDVAAACLTGGRYFDFGDGDRVEIETRRPNAPVPGEGNQG